MEKERAESPLAIREAISGIATKIMEAKKKGMADEVQNLSADFQREARVDKEESLLKKYRKMEENSSNGRTRNASKEIETSR